MFSQDSRDCHTTFVQVSQNLCIVNLPKFHSDKLVTLAQMSHDCCATYFG